LFLFLIIDIEKQPSASVNPESQLLSKVGSILYNNIEGISSKLKLSFCFNLAKE
jgi:hypothetical protein